MMWVVSLGEDLFLVATDLDGPPNEWPLPAEALIAEAHELVARPVAKLIVCHGEEGDHWELVGRARHMLAGLVEVSSPRLGAPIEIEAPGVSNSP